MGNEGTDRSWGVCLCFRPALCWLCVKEALCHPSAVPEPLLPLVTLKVILLIIRLCSKYSLEFKV